MAPTNESELTPPRSSPDDRYYAAIKIALSAVPVAGAPLAEIFATLFQAPLVKRQQKWMEDVARTIAALQETGRLSLEDLRDDDQFLDALVQAGRVAAGTSVEVKLASLRNAVANTAIAPRLESPEQHLFIRMVEDFTEWHLRILKLFADPDTWFEERSLTRPRGNMRTVVHTAFPELSEQNGLVSPIWRDLYVRSLVKSERVLDEVYDHETQAEQVTGLGRRFLELIAAPL